jgi:pyrroline-5-carboxylate reductase
MQIVSSCCSSMACYFATLTPTMNSQATAVGLEAPVAYEFDGTKVQACRQQQHRQCDQQQLCP